MRIPQKKMPGTYTAYDYLIYKNPRLIKSVPVCPKHNSKHRVESDGVIRQLNTGIDMRVIGKYTCERCKLFFTIPQQSHIILSNGRWKRI